MAAIKINTKLRCSYTTLARVKMLSSYVTYSHSTSISRHLVMSIKEKTRERGDSFPLSQKQPS